MLDDMLDILLPGYDGQTITTIIFDFGKTIHNFNLDLFFDWMAKVSGVSRYHLWDIFSHYPDGLLYRYECGEATQNFIVRVRNTLQKLYVRLYMEGEKVAVKDFTDAEFIANWNDIFDTNPVAEDRLRLMRGLKKHGYKLYVLSNINQAQLEYLKNDTRFNEIFTLVEQFIASCDIQCRKTRFHADNFGNNWQECCAVFHKSLDITESRFQDTIYIDDILDYVEVFRRLGGHGIHHTGPWTKVEAELYKLGVRWE
ncbi:MAG: hypothetical protein HY001_01010 [Candidatus Portnoybacteria bacterium]|nr:hypothetical protein [Candidatus Portnoybacteria bacterium]